MATLRYQGDPRQVMEQTRAVWRKMAPGTPFDGAHADRRLIELHAADDRAARLFGMGAGLAVLALLLALVAMRAPRQPMAMAAGE